MMSPAHWIIVVLVVLLLFGAGRLGEVGKGLGDGIRNFKKGLAGDEESDEGADAKQLKDGKPQEAKAAAPEERKEKV
ncbi:MAG TPA: twin-arginine translocase TatA/TatE family subunit [Polyangiaceae bacterium]|jgi:sec-independent protein translocase protein TatA|nr:twin-arginine translocase TatA/TatE family subunit [Polyangiaceae bacterium]